MYTMVCHLMLSDVNVKVTRPTKLEILSFLKFLSFPLFTMGAGM